jgi:hypothetical protein
LAGLENEAMHATLLVLCRELGENQVQGLTQDLCRTIGDNTNIEAELPPTSAGQGTKGDPVTLGTIALTFISSGAAVALVNVLKSYFERQSSLEIKIKGENNKEVSIGAKNLHPEELRKTIETVDNLLRKV